MRWLRHVWLAFFEPWPKHMNSCLFCSSVEMPEPCSRLEVEEPREADFVFVRSKR